MSAPVQKIENVLCVDKFSDCCKFNSLSSLDVLLKGKHFEFYIIILFFLQRG